MKAFFHFPKIIIIMKPICYTTSYFLILFNFIVVNSMSAQEEKEKPAFYTGISPIILERNATEINFLNNVNSFWWALKEYNPDNLSTRVANRYRYTRVEQLLRVTYGFSKNKNWDLSGELKFAHARLDDAARSSLFKVFSKDTVGGKSYHGLSTIGLRGRWMPFSNIPELTLQGTLQYPIARSAEERKWLDAQRTQIGLAATYYIQSGENIYFFFQTDWSTRLKSTDNHRMTHLASIGTNVVIRVWEQQFFVFPGLNYGLTLQKFSSKGSLHRINQSLFGNAGVFIQPNPRFSVMLNLQLPFILESGSQYIEYVRESFTGFTLGIRTQF